MSGAASPFFVRPLRAGDAPEWRALWTAYLAFYETCVSEEVYRTSFARLLSDAPGEFRGFIAREGAPGAEGAAIGLVHCLAHRHCWSVADVIYLQDLYAAPAARGQGVGRALIEAVYALADAEGAANVYWLTQSFNEPARRLYDRIGAETPFIKYARR